MMLKDEAKNLPRCLSSIRALCDEIVIVDTGSTDDTVKIAKEYGAIVYPGPFNWRKPPVFDFSLHRNAGLQYCEELGADWVFVIDGDEQLKDIGISPEEFKARLMKLPANVHALSTQVHENQNGEFLLSFWGTRFFRMGVGVFYDGICHNRPHLFKGGYTAATNIVIYHYGYQNQQVMEGKRIRTLALLEKRIRENPVKDYEAYYYKCLTLCGQDKLDEAIASGEKCMEILSDVIDDDPERLSYFGILYYAIGWAYFRKWEFTKEQEFATKAYQWWMTGWELWPNDIDLNFELCVLGYLGEQKDMIKEHGSRYLSIMERYRSELNPDLDGFVNTVQFSDLAIGPRHVHHASSKHEAMVKSMMREAA